MKVKVFLEVSTYHNTEDGGGGGERFHFSPRVMLLGDFTGCSIGSSKDLLINMLAATVTVIANKWKTSEVLSSAKWINKLRFMEEMSKFIHNMQLQERAAQCSGELYY